MQDAEIIAIIDKEFAETPRSIARMGNGICNEVFLVDTSEREVIVRLHTEARYMLGSHYHIPVFRALGIRVPEILAEDYTKSYVPFAYQVVSKIDGRDINDVIDTLTDDQLRAVAVEVANVFRRLREVPNNGKFGVLWGDGDDLVDSWTEDIRRMSNVVMGWGAKTGILNEELAGILEWINLTYRSYFDGIEPVTYFGDICAKNVMIHEGHFSGLVDLDSLGQGDPLEAVGRIKASWYGTHHGRVYSDAVMDELDLSDEERCIVTTYALLNRTFWTMENGIEFNRNTSAKVDPAREKQDKMVVRALYEEMKAFD